MEAGAAQHDDTKAEGEDDSPQAEAGGQVLLFTGKFEGVKVDDFRLNFGGNIMLGDKALIDALKLDEDVTLIVKGKVRSRGHKLKAAKDGAKGSAVSSATVVIDTVALEEA